MRRLAALLLALGAAAATVGHTHAHTREDVVAAPAAIVTSSRVAGNFCLTLNTPAQYASMFDSEPGGVIGADYQRATEMPNGDVLWTFQDAEVRLPNGTSTLVHNIGMVQQGTCFTVLIGGSPSAPEPWLFAADTAPFSRWYWPLDATPGNDGRMYVFVAEMLERGDHYLDHVEPMSTLVASVDIDSHLVEQLGPARNSSAELYGWTSATDDDWTYLYAHCYRQFGWGDFEIHDHACSARVTVARVPKGNLFAAHTYWTGRGWSSNPRLAAPMVNMTNRHVNALDVTRANNRWLAVIKVDDWFGDTIVVESAPRPVGPFSTIMTLSAAPKCDPAVCNTYYASWIPNGPAGTMTIGLSNNRWDGILSGVYKPSYRTIPTPGYVRSPADRCSLGYCD